MGHPEGARIVSDALLIAIKEVGRASPAGGVIQADDTVDALIDVLASFISGSPMAATLRSKRLYLDQISKRLKDRTDEYIAVRVRQAGAGELIGGRVQ